MGYRGHGGDVVGIGIAINATSRGLDTLLTERETSGKGTLEPIDQVGAPGVRYLDEGNILLAMEAIRERGLLLRNASHIVREQSFAGPSFPHGRGPSIASI